VRVDSDDCVFNSEVFNTEPTIVVTINSVVQTNVAGEKW
jgi:hypothetical protein